MESPGPYPDSPVDGDDVVYPCKGCGEILEEGKAFELAGNRWHIQCFKCNTCGDPLDSDANLLLLGDGSLICNKCTYSCNACGNKIEDLAILTGDQAFCANCFRCRNCKRKIENLRYARTSQGIFCMSCHESLMARRRKKSRQRQQAASANASGHMVLDKSLPALPPNAANTTASFTPELDTPTSEPYSETTDRSPRPRQKSRKEPSPANLDRGVSPAPTSEDSQKSNMTLPASTYRESERLQTTDVGEEEAFIPLAFDPNPAPGPSPMVKNKKFSEEPTPKSSDSRNQRDYFNTSRPSQSAPREPQREAPREPQREAQRDPLREAPKAPSRSSSSEGEAPQQQQIPPPQPSPHIAYQEKGRHPSDNLADALRKRKEVPTATPAKQPPTQAVQQDPSPAARTSSNVGSGFKLQDVPLSKKAGSRRGSKSDNRSNQNSPAVDLVSRLTSPAPDSAKSTGSSVYEATTPDPKKQEEQAAIPQQQKLERPARGDSLAASSLKNTLTRKVSVSKSSPSTPTAVTHERKGSLQNRDASQTNGAWSISSPLESKGLLDPPPRAPGRGSFSAASTNESSYTTPRAAPAPPQHKPTESISSISSDMAQVGSPPVGLPRYSGGPDFSLDADMARILGANEEHEHREPSVLRKVSNAVSRHGRSFSDRGSRGSNTYKVKSPVNGSIDISSPVAPSPDSKEELIELRNQLRRAQQRITELEAEKLTWQEQNSSADIKQANTELREKRSTISILDTQREMLIRELEIMTEEVGKAKDQRKSDPAAVKSVIYEKFSASLEKLKDNIGDQIEELVQKRQDLTNEITTLIQMKDKGFQEYESLSSKNQQLLEMNKDLVQSIQDMYKANRAPQPKGSFEGVRGPNGLGIYSHHKDKSDLSMDLRSQDSTILGSYGADLEDAQIIRDAPAIVEVKKAKPMKFSTWKKGGQNAAKGLAKGFKGAFASEKQGRDEVFISHPYGSSPGGAEPLTIISAPQMGGGGPRSATEPQRPGFGFFGKEKGKPSQLKHSQSNSSNTNLVAAEPPSTLFGSDLSARCDFEKRTIPSIVIKCIQEVQIRGMDLEGIYRKSGGTGQINAIRQGFESQEDYDISDPDLDITAVTSVLKQYLRRLPNPLITFDVYDRFLQAGAIQDKEKRWQEIRACLNDLPRAHLECIQFLVFHLAQVVSHPTAKMTPLNLAVVFAPTMMRPTSIEREMTDMANQKNAVQALIEDVDKVFSGETP